MGIKFYKLKEENIPSSTNEDCVIFTDTGNIYVSMADGSLLKMCQQSGGTGGTDTLPEGSVNLTAQNI